ncbi:MAG: outer membrane beta-barrel protein [Pseudomonadota bacterium]
MKKSILKLTVATAVLLNATVVMATDYNSGVVTKSPSVVHTPVEFGSGWYIRGDIGVGVSGSADVAASRAARSGDLDADADADYSVGVGFGYIFNQHFRSDATFDVYSGGDWSGGASGCGVDALGVAYTGSCSSSDGGEFESHNAMLNAYFNLGSFGGLSPYIGGGIGVAHIELSNTVSISRCTVDPGENCDLGVHSGATANPESFTGPAQRFTSEDSINFAYALMAGVDYRIDEHWTADVGYRYTNITADELFSSTTTTDTISFDGVEIHEVRAGLRYDIW